MYMSDMLKLLGAMNAQLALQERQLRTDVCT